ncbi:Ger(x)C family spore germination protein [Clostridium sp. DL1XJH146]
MEHSYFIKRSLLILMIFMLSFATGCWNKKELNELGIVGAIAIDEEEDKVKLSYEIMEPKSINTKGTDQENVSYLQSEGASILDAIRNATLKFDKKLYWPHTNVLFFNEKAAYKGLAQYLDIVNRDHEFRRYINLTITKGSPAYEVMGINSGKEGIPSLFIEKLYENNIYNGKGVSVKIIDFLKAYYAEGIEPVVGVIEVVKRSDDKLKIDEKKNEKYIPSIEGAAVLRDDKLVGFLDGIETRAFNLITGKLKSGVIVSKSPDRKGINSVEIIKAQSKMNIEIKDEVYYGYVDIEISGVIGEETGEEDISNIRAISQIERNTSDIIKKEVEDCIKIVQGYKTDIFGFGQLIHRKYPENWSEIKNEWNEDFSNLEIEVTVKTNIEKSGVSNSQLEAKENK